jgi:hypothetical protein
LAGGLLLGLLALLSAFGRPACEPAWTAAECALLWQGRELARFQGLFGALLVFLGIGLLKLRRHYC